MTMTRSIEARQLANERRSQDKERTLTRNASRNAKYAPLNGFAGAGAWS
jgi:hypothetical protein